MKTLICFFTLLFSLSAFNAQPFLLPKLPYNYDQYAPQIDAKTMEIHLTKHHQTYVNNLNKAILAGIYESKSIEELLFEASENNETIRNNAGGHYNHSLFWEILAPIEQQGAISAEFEEKILLTFGSMDSLKKAMFVAATSRFGSGWAWLVLTPNNELKVCSTINQENPIMTFSSIRGVPIIGIDVWEHAYYLNYQNRRLDYLNAVWSLLAWDVLSNKYNQAKNSSTMILIEKDWPVLNKLMKQVNQIDLMEKNGDHQLMNSSVKIYVLTDELLFIPKYYQNNEIRHITNEIMKLGEQLNNDNLKHKRLNKLYNDFYKLQRKLQDLKNACNKL